VISLDYHYLSGVPGVNWTGNVGGVSPTNAVIGTATNWELAWGQREYVAITRVDVNSPFGGNYAAAADDDGGD